MSSVATRVQGRAVSETVSKDELLARVWHGTVVEENNLTQISTLRKVLGELRSKPEAAFRERWAGYLTMR
jgi:DNA-binding winged helix-turn-helix (wHTH) protein